MIDCKNCNRDLAAQYAYCPDCGQKAALHRLTAHDIIHEGIHYFTHADRGIFQLIRDLALKRGVVAREYIDGRRRKYFPPLNFFLLIAGFFVFAATLGEPREAINVLEAHPEINLIKDPIAKQDAIAMWTRKHTVNHVTKSYSNIFAMFALPLTAFIFWLFFRKAKYNFVEHLVAGMYMLGFCILVYALVFLPLAYLLGIDRNFATMGFFLLQVVYFTAFYNGFLAKHSKKEYLKTGLVTLCAMITWVVFSSVLIYTYITNGFWGLL